MSGLLSLDHFSFNSPQYLWGLLVAPLLFLFVDIVRHRRSQYSVSFTNLEMLARVAAKRRPHWRRRLPVILLALALSTAVAALAHPRIQLVTSDRSATFVLLADVSDSMQATDIHPARIYAAVDAMHAFVDELPGSDKVGLITFSDKAKILAAPTNNHTAVDNALDGISPEGGTALGLGVEAAVKLVLSSLASDGIYHTPGQYLPAAIVLESDGAQDRGTVSPLQAAGLAQAAGIRIYGVALGTRHGYIVQGSGLLRQVIQALPDPSTVEVLAHVTGGEAFDATTAPSLDTIYRDLGGNISRHPKLTDITSWFDVAAALLLLAGVGAARVRGPALP
jgi:Ca-activated chloride channel family protein